MTLAQGLRSGNLFSKRDQAVLDAPETGRAPKDWTGDGAAAGLKRRAAVTEMPLRRDSGYPDHRADDSDSERTFRPPLRRAAVRVSFRGPLLPKTLWGRIAVGTGFLIAAGAAIVLFLSVRSFLLHDQHFIVPAPDSIQVAGASRLSQAQLLSIFGEDVDRNIFNIPLAERRATLESLPWVAHATVMRLLPNRVRVAIVERTPVAFVRQGGEIGLVDAKGALFDLPSPAANDSSAEAGGDATKYSFPVLTGVTADDPLSTRAARMKIYLEFVAAVDAGGEGVSRLLSEVDVSNPEDVKAVLSDAGANNGGILVHFGEEKYLERYHQYQTHLAEWRAQYPKLASVDLRYDQQVVLEMQKDSGAAAGAASSAATGTAGAAVGVSPDGATAAVGPTAKTAPGPTHMAPGKAVSAKIAAAKAAQAKTLRMKAKSAGKASAKVAWHSSPAQSAPVQIPSQEAGQ